MRGKRRGVPWCQGWCLKAPRCDGRRRGAFRGKMIRARCVKLTTPFWSYKMWTAKNCVGFFFQEQEKLVHKVGPGLDENNGEARDLGSIVEHPVVAVPLQHNDPRVTAPVFLGKRGYFFLWTSRLFSLRPGWSTWLPWSKRGSYCNSCWTLKQDDLASLEKRWAFIDKKGVFSICHENEEQQNSPIAKYVSIRSVELFIVCQQKNSSRGAHAGCFDRFTRYETKKDEDPITALSRKEPGENQTEAAGIIFNAQALYILFLQSLSKVFFTEVRSLMGMSVTWAREETIVPLQGWYHNCARKI